MSKKILALFTMISMTVNMMATPLSSQANQKMVLMNRDRVDGIGGYIQNRRVRDRSSVETTTGSTTAEEVVAIKVEEKTEASRTDDVLELLAGSYETGGKWTFDQESVRLVLTGGTLNRAIGEDSWIKSIHRNEIKEIYVVDATGAEDLNVLFNSYSVVKEITFENFDTSQVLDMSNMFRNCLALTKIDVSSFNTGKVATMPSMFYNCESLEKLNLGNTTKLATNTNLRALTADEF